MYLVVELQKNGTSLANICTSYEDRNQAESKFFTILAAAAISNVEKHSAALLDEDGMCIRNGGYVHPVEPEPTPEPEVISE